MEEEILSRICSVCAPERVILFGEKRTLNDRLKSLSLCVIVPDGDKTELLRQLYLAVEVEVPVDFVLYTRGEWDELLENQSTYAAWIGRRGRVIYEQTA